MPAVMTLTPNVAIEPPAKHHFHPHIQPTHCHQRTIIQMMQWKMQKTRTEHSSTSQVDLAHAVTCFNTNFAIETHAKTNIFILFYVQSIAIKQQQSYK